jgi:hypothetical protein
MCFLNLHTFMCAGRMRLCRPLCTCTLVYYLYTRVALPFTLFLVLLVLIFGKKNGVLVCLNTFTHACLFLCVYWIFCACSISHILRHFVSPPFFLQRKMPFQKPCHQRMYFCCMGLLELEKPLQWWRSSYKK